MNNTQIKIQTRGSIDIQDPYIFGINNGRVRHGSKIRHRPCIIRELLIYNLLTKEREIRLGVLFMFRLLYDVHLLSQSWFPLLNLLPLHVFLVQFHSVQTLILPISIYSVLMKGNYKLLILVVYGVLELCTEN